MTAADSVTEAILQEAKRPDFWRSLNPGMTIDARPLAANRQYSLADAEIHNYAQQMLKEGYFQARPLVPGDEVKRLRECLLTIRQAGFPPAFVFVYDAFWQLFHKLHPLYKALLGPDLTMSQNMWAWYVDKSTESSGWKPHRDLVGYQTLESNGRPRFATVWIPLTDVTPLNACMYVLPTHLDPWVKTNELTKTNIPVEHLQDIRALPAPAGSVLSWNANVLHWGARSSEHAAEPRISIACSLMNTNAVTPTGEAMAGLPLNPSLEISFEKRLALISLVITHYHSAPIDAIQFSPTLLRFCQTYLSLVNAAPPRPKVTPPRAPSSSGPKVGRNDPCPCGSGVKFKRCHGQA